MEIAVDACGDAWRWQPLAERLTADRVYGHDDFDARLPLAVQQSYARAAETRLFSGYEVCETYETLGDEVLSTRSYLFGVQEFAHVGTCLFLIDQWDG